MDHRNRLSSRRALPFVTALALVEERHRTANEIASALAGVKLASRGHPDAEGILATVAERLEGFARTLRLIADPGEAGDDIVDLLGSLVDAFAAGRPRLVPQLTAPARSVTVTSRLAASVLNVAHEALTNADKHSPSPSRVSLRLNANSEFLELTCSNPIGPLGPTGRRGLGVRIMSETCLRAGGHLEVRTHRGVYSVRATFRRAPIPDG